RLSKREIAMKIDGGVALVTGAGTGVGAATARLLASKGCRVAINYRSSKDRAEEVISQIEESGGVAFSFQADVAVDQEARALVEATRDKYGRLDVLVNNAGITEFIPFDDLDAVTDEVWHRLHQVNVVGAFHCARAAARLMRATGGADGAEMVNVGSIAGIKATGSCIPYAASKAALHNLTVALARTLAPRIRVNAVAPGFITGRWLKNGLGEGYDATKAAFEKAMPLQAVCDPEDVAAAIVSLVEGSNLVTGQILACDGGMSIAEPTSI
ncbi:MAG: SDR family oxidoreductase, partial [Opitutales bacterium]